MISSYASSEARGSVWLRLNQAEVPVATESHGHGLSIQAQRRAKLEPWMAVLCRDWAFSRVDLPLDPKLLRTGVAAAIRCARTMGEMGPLSALGFVVASFVDQRATALAIAQSAPGSLCVVVDEERGACVWSLCVGQKSVCASATRSTLSAFTEQVLLGGKVVSEDVGELRNFRLFDFWRSICQNGERERRELVGILDASEFLLDRVLTDRGQSRKKNESMLRDLHQLGRWTDPVDERSLPYMTPREGDEKRFQSILAAVVEANTRLVAWRVEQRVPISPLLDRVDFFQHGVIGLAHAALRFRPEKGTKFTTYAVPWIDQRVSRAVSFEASLVRDKRNNHSPREAIRTAERVISIEDPEVKRFLLQSIDNACSSELVEHLIFMGQLRAILVGALRNLREKERFVLLARYGFLGMEVTTLEQIGAFLGLTRERVRQIQVRAEERMRTLLGKFEGDLFD